MIKNIIFDIDRTLVDSYESEIITLWQAVKEVTNLDISLEKFGEIATGTEESICRAIGISVDSNKYIAINKRWDELIKNTTTKCFEGIKKLIRELKEKGYFLGIVTSRKYKEFSELSDELADVADCFDVVVTCDLVERPKPDKESFEYIRLKYGINPEETVYIGDSETDKIFAKNSDIKFIQAAWENKVLDNCLYAKSIQELKNILLKI